jgi:hypothetical protein
MSKRSIVFIAVLAAVGVLGLWRINIRERAYAADDPQVANAERMIHAGRRIFRFDTFGDEAFWGGTLKLHEAIEGKAFGGVGPGLTPGQALAAGLKVDIDALLPALKRGMMLHQALGASRTILSHADLNDAAITLALLRSNAVIGLTGVFNSSGTLESVGIQCALCHSTVDDSVGPGIGHRLDGWANRDLNVGAIVSLSPNLQPVADLLGVNVPTVRQVLN